MNRILFLIPMFFFFFYSCNIEDDNFAEEFTWSQVGKFEFINKFKIEVDEDFGRFSEGAFINIDNNTILSVYTRFDVGSNDSTSASLVSRKSFDRGITWGEEKVLVRKSDDILNVMSANLIRLDNGDIGLIYLIKETIVNCYPVIAISKDNGETFSSYETIIESGKGYYVLNNSRVTKLSSGRIIVPLCEFDNNGLNLTTWKGKIFYMFSDDSGRTWGKSSYLPACETDVTEQEPGIVELIDGSLLMYVRTNKGAQFFSRSYDNGETWSDFNESNLISPLSPATILQMTSGEKPLIAIWNNSVEERRPLTIALSYDKGETWINKYNICSDSFSSYPAVLNLGNGELLISYSYSDLITGGLQNYSIEKLKYSISDL